MPSPAKTAITLRLDDDTLGELDARVGPGLGKDGSSRAHVLQKALEFWFQAHPRSISPTLPGLQRVGVNPWMEGGVGMGVEGFSVPKTLPAHRPWERDPCPYMVLPFFREECLPPASSSSENRLEALPVRFGHVRGAPSQGLVLTALSLAGREVVRILGLVAYGLSVDEDGPEVEIGDLRIGGSPNLRMREEADPIALYLKPGPPPAGQSRVARMEVGLALRAQPLLLHPNKASLELLLRWPSPEAQGTGSVHLYLVVEKLEPFDRMSAE